ncbi:MAG: sulfite exporter TauE/SafE family protein [Phycisphaerales bacterium]|nr:sulfite exporter TauE/SafE family protein [Phycisphaerales bacterium]
MDVHSAALVWLIEIAIASFFGGVIGAISGLGGGIVIVPVLTILMHLPITDAIGASIVSVIAVSSGAGSVYVRDHITNVRIAMFLEVSTATGAIFGAAVLAPLLNHQVLMILFGLTLLFSLVPVLANIGEELPKDIKSGPWAKRMKMRGSYFDKRLGREITYQAARLRPAIGIMFVAGLMAGILGIGAGVLKVLAQEISMRLPAKVSTATSNFMIGVTAAAAAGVYLRRGLVLPFLVAPVAGAVLLGAMCGTKLMERMSNVLVRKVFALALGFIGIEMLLRGFGFKF